MYERRSNQLSLTGQGSDFLKLTALPSTVSTLVHHGLPGRYPPVPACTDLFKLCSFTHLKAGRSMWLVHRQHRDTEGAFLVIIVLLIIRQAVSPNREFQRATGNTLSVCWGPPPRTAWSRHLASPLLTPCGQKTVPAHFRSESHQERRWNAKNQPDLLFCPSRVSLAASSPELAVPGLLRGWCNPQGVAAGLLEGLGCPAPAKPR